MARLQYNGPGTVNVTTYNKKATQKMRLDMAKSGLIWKEIKVNRKTSVFNVIVPEGITFTLSGDVTNEDT